jgi:hypothetical protein
MVRDRILSTRPGTVLIEGPADFNDRIDELSLKHTPPISIYSYVAWDDGSRQGAYYPMCEYSPEWQALQAAREVGAQARFIDLPFAVVARDDRRAHRYADDRLRSSDYVEALCESFGVENFDDAWDLIAEQDPGLSACEIQKRVAEYCRCLREMDGCEVRESDRQRESYMAAHIRAARQEFGPDKVVVITGGYHTSGLQELLSEAAPGDTSTKIRWPEAIDERGIALTPYSFERLDNLTGYEAGMPSPGFYQEAWLRGDGIVHRTLLERIAQHLRDLKQTASTADLIAVEVSALALASMRGHARVWRRDLIDAVISALVKDDFHAAHPFLRATQKVLRGGERGQLAEGSPQPPLAEDIRRCLDAAELTPGPTAIERKLILTDPAELEISRLLHRLRILEISGFRRSEGVDFAARGDLATLGETWIVQWLPDQDANMIEASRYGSALGEAAAACLAEKADELKRSASSSALLLIDSVLAGVMVIATELRSKLSGVIREDGDLASVATAMGHLLFLYSWDDTLGARDSDETGEILKEAYERALWLLESGSTAVTSKEQVESVCITRDVFERAESNMELDRDSLAEVLATVQADLAQSPAMRGACAGALWSLNRAAPQQILSDLRSFAKPDQLGDFLTGLFALAREEAQRDGALLQAIHSLVVEWGDDEFLAALPSLRLAFMYFTAREKHHLAGRLFSGDRGTAVVMEPAPLAVSSTEAAEAMAFESKLLQLAKEYGVKIDFGEASYRT